MNEKQIVTSILLGGAMIALGLIPGPLAALKEELQNFRGKFAEEYRPGIPRQKEAEMLPGQVWIAVAGFALLTLGLAVLIGR